MNFTFTGAKFTAGISYTSPKNTKRRFGSFSFSKESRPQHHDENLPSTVSLKATDQKSTTTSITYKVNDGIQDKHSIREDQMKLHPKPLMIKQPNVNNTNKINDSHQSTALTKLSTSSSSLIQIGSFSTNISDRLSQQTVSQQKPHPVKKIIIRKKVQAVKSSSQSLCTSSVKESTKSLNQNHVQSSTSTSDKREQPTLTVTTSTTSVPQEISSNNFLSRTESLSKPTTCNSSRNSSSTSFTNNGTPVANKMNIFEGMIFYILGNSENNSCKVGHSDSQSKSMYLNAEETKAIILKYGGQLAPTIENDSKITHVIWKLQPPPHNNISVDNNITADDQGYATALSHIIDCCQSDQERKIYKFLKERYSSKSISIITEEQLVDKVHVRAESIIQESPTKLLVNFFDVQKAKFILPELKNQHPQLHAHPLPIPQFPINTQTDTEVVVNSNSIMTTGTVNTNPENVNTVDRNDRPLESSFPSKISSSSQNQLFQSTGSYSAVLPKSNEESNKRKVVSPYKSNDRNHALANHPSKYSKNLLHDKSVITNSSNCANVNDQCITTKLGTSMGSINNNNPATKSLTFCGKTFSLLGRNFSLPRQELIQLIHNSGADVTKNVTKRVTHLILGRDAHLERSEKYQLAAERKLVILREHDFLAMTNNLSSESMYTNIADSGNCDQTKSDSKVQTSKSDVAQILNFNRLYQ